MFGIAFLGLKVKMRMKVKVANAEWADPQNNVVGLSNARQG